MRNVRRGSMLEMRVMVELGLLGRPTNNEHRSCASMLNMRYDNMHGVSIQLEIQKSSVHAK